MNKRDDFKNMVLNAPEVEPVFLALSAALLWTWISLFHESGLAFCFLKNFTPNEVTYVSHLNCIAQPTGFIAALLYRYAQMHVKSLKNRSVKLPPCTAPVFAGIITLAFYLTLSDGMPHESTALAIFCASALGYSIWLTLFMRAAELERHAILYLVVGCCICQAGIGMVVALFPSEHFAPCSLVVHFTSLAVYTALCAIGRNRQRKPEAEATACGVRSEDPLASKAAVVSERRITAPLPLIVHIALYGMGFGVIHSATGFSEAEAAAQSPLFEAAQILMIAVFILLFRKMVTQEDELWQKVRGVVFPLTCLCYILIPLMPTSAVPYCIAMGMSLIYEILFALGVFTMARETIVPAKSIVIIGYLIKSLGFLAGLLLGVALGLANFITETQWMQIVSVCVFLMFSLGTFWIGSEKQMRRWWGLRREYSPKYHHDQRLAFRCKEIAEAAFLTRREAEILLMLANGKRAAQIGEECCCTVHTARNHIQKIYRKLNVHSGDELLKLLRESD